MPFLDFRRYRASAGCASKEAKKSFRDFLGLRRGSRTARQDCLDLIEQLLGNKRLAECFEEMFKELTAQEKYKGLLPFPLEKLHNGYFAQDKKGTFKDTSGDTQADDDVFGFAAGLRGASHGSRVSGRATDSLPRILNDYRTGLL